MALNIAIIGCGIGGLACSLYLTQAQHSVTLYDQFEKASPVGSGLVIQPVGQDVLNELGCGEAAIEAGAKIFTMYGIDSCSRKAVLHVDYGPIDAAVFGLGIHRADLFDVLFKAVQKTSVNLRSNQAIQSSHVKTGQRFITNINGEVFGPYDLVIDTSGAHSKLSSIKTKPLKFGALWGTVNWPDNTPLANNQLSQCYQNANKMMGILPLGRPEDKAARKATIFWSEPRGTLPNWPQHGLTAWQDEAIALWPEFAPFIHQIQNPERMTATRYSHGTLLRPYGDKLAILGDAAHQASPQLGQGANMALLDAKALCDALTHHDIDTALKLYARRRFAHVRLYQIFSRIFTPFYQSSSVSLPWLRNHVMHPFSRIWPIKPLLTRLVCGHLIRP